MKTNAVAFLAGLLFAVGLGIGGMTLPSKVVGFLDIAGNWDASLAFVMGGAIMVYAVIYRIATRRPAPIFAAAFALPSRNDIDGRLIAGSALFGIGWGLGGLCPGPALVSLAWLDTPVVIFVAAMCAGMLIHGWIGEMRSSSRAVKESFAVVADA